MKKTSLATWLIAPLALATQAAAAQSPQAATPDTVDPQDRHSLLEVITVIGTRTETLLQNNPVSVSIIDRDEIRREAPESVVELLRNIPGVSIVDTSAPGMQRIRIRGESSRRVTILIDGQEITDHSTNGTPLLADPANVERIEVLRGAASVLYGAKAIGGVINVITRRGAPVPLQVEAGGSGYTGSNGWQGWTAISGTVDRIDYRLGGSMNRHHDREVPKSAWSRTGELPNSSYHSGDATLHVGYRFGAADNHYLALKLNKHWLETDAWTDPASFEYPVTDFFVDLPQRDLSKVGLYYDADNLSPLVAKVHVDAYRQVVDRLFANRVAMKPTPIIDVTVRSTSDDQNVNYGGTAQVDFRFHPAHYTIAGLYYLNDDLDTHKTTDVTSKIGPRPPETEHEARHDQAVARTASLFVQDEWSLPHDLRLTAGVRHYRFRARLDGSTDPAHVAGERRNARDLVKSVGLTWDQAPGITWRTLYSEGYIMPTLLELFTDNSAGRGQITYGNTALAPEQSHNVEFGLRVHRGNWVVDAGAYRTRARDYITTQSCADSDRCPTGALPGTLVYVNADGAVTFGVELLAEYDAWNGALVPYVSAAWGRRKLEFPSMPRNDGATSGYDDSLPRVTGRAGLRHDGSFRGAAVWGDLYLRGATHSGASPVTEAQHLLVGETSGLAGWTTLNLSFGASLGSNERYRFSLHFNNIFDRGYRTSVDELPALGRNVIGSFQLTF